MTMRQIARIRFFCSHNCFEVFDADYEPWGQSSELDDLTSEGQELQLLRGFYRRGESIVYRTVAHGNVHRIDVIVATEHTVPSGVDRVLAQNINLPSGKLTIFGLDVGETVQIGSGQHAIFCRGFNLGVDHFEDISDEQFLQRDDLERYELVLVPGRTSQEGVVFGPPTLDSFYERRNAQWAQQSGSRRS